MRDALGRITEKTETIDGVTTVWGYDYDDAGRLTDVFKDGVAYASYVYDDNGNRLSRTTATGTETGTYDAQDRITSYGACTYDQTFAGELLRKTCPVTGQPDDITDLVYDALGNLRSVTLPDGTEITYHVDGENRRVWKLVDGVKERGFLWGDDLRIVAELDATGTVVSRFVYADGVNVPELMIQGTTTYRIVKDHLGSPRAVVDVATGVIAQRMDYDEFGRVLSDTNPGFQPFGFAGGLYDPDTGLVRFGARDYDAETGRWTAQDPLRFEGGDTNLYAYVASDPINFIDSQGRNAIAVAVGAVTGVAATLACMASKDCRDALGQGMAAAGEAAADVANAATEATFGVCLAIAETLIDATSDQPKPNQGPYRARCERTKGTSSPVAPGTFPQLCEYECPGGKIIRYTTADACPPYEVL